MQLAELVGSQEPLGQEFSTVLHDNLWNLYPGEPSAEHEPTHHNLVYLADEMARFVHKLDWPSAHYYVVYLVSRKKYGGSDSMVASMLAGTPDRLIRGVHGLECSVRAYRDRNGGYIPTRHMAVYVSTAPVSRTHLHRAMAMGLMDSIIGPTMDTKTINSILRASLKSCKRHRSRVVFDFDTTGGVLETISTCVNLEACVVVKTHSGYHVWVAPHRVDPLYGKTWYNNLCAVADTAVSMTPLPGTLQGGYPVKVTYCVD